MKTSNKLILTAFILVLISLAAYDYLLKNEYDSGRYKDPNSNYTELKFRDFDAVDIVSSTAANVRFVQGPFSVKLDKDAAEFTFVKQNGKRLIIDARFRYNYLYNQNPYLLIISCPKLSAINADAFYTAKNVTVIDTTAREDWNMRKILIAGFKLDSLSINQSYGSTVVLANNSIKVLNATVGIMPQSGSKIDILNTNNIQQGNIKILNKSSFALEGGITGTLNYQLADSAKMTVSASAQHIISNAKPLQK